MAASTDDLTPGKTQQLNWITFDQMTSRAGVKQFAILLYPFRTMKPSVEINPVTEDHFTVRTPHGTDDLYFLRAPLDDGVVSTDASFLVVRHGSDRPSRYCVVNGTYVSFKGKAVWQSTRRTSAEGVLHQ